MTLTPEQHKRRSKGLGGSDIGAMLGLSKWKSPMDLWAEKTGRVIPPDIGDKEFIHFGNVLEDVVAREFMLRTGKTVHRKRGTIQHPKYSFMLGNIDRRVVGERAGLECKTSSAWLQQEWGETGSDDVPLYYLTQCIHYMEVLNYDRFYCAVLLGGNEFRWYVIERDADVAASMIEKEAAFWRLVLANEPPDAMNFPDLVTLYPKEEKAGIVATDAIFRALSNYQQFVHDKSQIEAAIDTVKMEIGDFMGPAGRLLDRSGTKLATWLAHERSTTDTAKLKDLYPDIYEELTTTTTVRPFRT